ncbi:MAG: alpha/beta fold hydrolase [Candidatus Aenigmatarchaeota archaeon]
MPLKISFAGHNGNLLSGVIHGKPDDNYIIISVHGFGTDRDYKVLRELSKHFEKRKISTMRFDFSGVGDSEGDVSDSSIEQMVDDLNAAVSYAKRTGFKKIIVAGHSLGGMVAILAAVMNKDIHALMLMAPAIDMKIAISRRKDTYKHIEGEMVEVAKTKVNKRFLENIERDAYDEAKKLNIPVLIIHGNRDRSCDILHSKKFYGMLKTAKKMVTIKNANHHFSKKTHLNMLLKEAHGWITTLS